MEDINLLDFARNELKLIGFDNSDLNNPMLEFLQSAQNVCHNNPDTMKQIVNLLSKLIDRMPLSPITENDFELEHQDDTITIYRCTRHPHIYSTGDGKYWNDRAIAFQFEDSNDIMYLYSSKNNSKQEITLPYFPKETIKVIERN
jgi:hypothetical protein